MPAVPEPLTDPLDLMLHIGSAKTGTSSIQRFLHRNRARLADLGLLYPVTPGRTRHTRLGLYIKPDAVLASTPAWQRQRFVRPERFRRTFHRQLLAEISQSGLSRVLFSDEALYGSPNEGLRRLRQFTDRIAGSVRLVVYLRRQDDQLVSRYQQEVKLAETRRMADWVPRLDLARGYDYYARLKLWEQLLEPDEFVVRRFERGRFVDGSLFQDFFEATSIGARADEMEPVEPVNESLDVEAVEFMRILNLYRGESSEANAQLDANRAIAARLAAVSNGPTLTAPTSFLDEFMARWEEANSRVAADFLGEAGVPLFVAPRDVSNTTTEQRLDPARLDHFLAVADLPEQVHPSLRRLAEREANHGSGALW